MHPGRLHSGTRCGHGQRGLSSEPDLNETRGAWRRAHTLLAGTGARASRPGPSSRTVTQSAAETAKHETLYGVKILAIRMRDSASSQLDQRLGLEQSAVTQSPVVQVAVSSLSVRNSVRMAGEDQEHIEALTAVQGHLPPIIVHRRTMRVIDGVHRLRAAKLQARDHIAVRFFDGDETDAHVLAVSSNIAHGLPLSLADRKAAAARIIVSHPQWSDRMIASVAGLAARTVAEIRKRPAIERAEIQQQDWPGRAGPPNRRRPGARTHVQINDPRSQPVPAAGGPGCGHLAGNGAGCAGQAVPGLKTRCRNSAGKGRS